MTGQVNTMPTDHDLADLLAQAGIDRTVDEVRDLIRGIAAAPGRSPAEWMPLIGADLPDGLVGVLTAIEKSVRDGWAIAQGTIADRVANLRDALARAGLTGVLIPRSDAHQGEYVPPRDERLAWITGFTGSAGMAVVLDKTAALFVDGRYTLQARYQSPSEIFEYRHLINEPVPDWFESHVSAGDRIGYDPWLHTPDAIGRLEKALAAVGASLVAVDTNPLDSIWSDQPPAPLAPVVPHPVKFAGTESREKRRTIGSDLEMAGLDAAILTLPDSIAWLLNVRGGDVPCIPFALSFAIIRSNGTVDWFVDERKLMPDTVRSLGNEVSLHAPSTLTDGLSALKDKKVRVDPASCPVWIVDRLEAAGADVGRGADPCQMPKACKTPAELAGSRNAHRRDALAVIRFLAWLDREAPTGRLSELTAVDQLLAYRREGALFQGPSFETISGAGPNSAVIHYRVTEDTNRPIESDSLYLVDSGAQYLDGTTDITRTIVVGTPTEEMRERYTQVLKGHIALARALFPNGTTGAQLDTLARQFLWQAGVDFDHGTGHGVGSYLSVHEGPQRISKAGGGVALAPGMIVSNEPGYYKAGAFGIRLENLVVVREEAPPRGAEKPVYGFETLTLAPFDHRLIKTDLLTQEERAWLDMYHARVLEVLSPDLDRDSVEWLEQATAPIG